MKFCFVCLIVLALLTITECGFRSESNNAIPPQATVTSTPPPTPSPTPAIPNLQTELRDDRNTTSKSPIAKFDFRNYTYPLPRGWQNPDGTDEITLKDGKVAPINSNANAKNRSDDDEQTASKYGRRIGMTYVATKYFDVTGDGNDEAIVILKIETEGSAIPQVVYVFSWKDGRPELIWPFRTGDRADGGLKNIFAENGNLVVELYGQDRFLLGQIETGRISDDLEQICCPTHFTRSVYKWNGKNFLMQGKRLTYSMGDPASPPTENRGDAAAKKNAKR